jgi:hypothetical protein
MMTPTGVSGGQNRYMKPVLFSLIFAAAVCGGPCAAAVWNLQGSYVDVQAQKGRQGPGPGPGYQRPDRGREAQPERRDERRERLTEDERRSLHRDLDKANRELYGRRQQK